MAGSGSSHAGRARPGRRAAVLGDVRRPDVGAPTFSPTTGEASVAPSATSGAARPRSRRAAAPVPTHPARPAAPRPDDRAPVAPEPAPAPEPAAGADVEPDARPGARAGPGAAPAPAPAPRPGRRAASDGSTEGQVLALVNAERAAAGCGALTADGGLASVARAHSEDMRDRGFFDHVNLDGLDPFDRADRAGVERAGREHRLGPAGRRRGHGLVDEQRRAPGEHPRTAA